MQAAGLSSVRGFQYPYVVKWSIRFGDYTVRFMEKPAKTLTADAIAAAALALIDAEGLEAFSTRRLGAQLGVEAMALYHHFPSKQVLLVHVATKLLESVPLPTDETLGWRAWMGQAARSFRSTGLAHPHAFPLLSHSVPISDVALRVLSAAGFSDRDASRMARIMASFLNGVLLAEIADPAAMDGVFERGLVMVLDGIARSLQRANVLS
jgi:AcrR family transcriptional regulator